MPPEPDSKDKKIAELEKHISEIRKTIPEIIFTAEDEFGNKISEIHRSISVYKNLNDIELENIISTLKKQYPIQNDFTNKASASKIYEYKNNFNDLKNLGFQEKYIPPSDEAIEKYKTEDYPNWIINLKEYISTLLLIFEASSRTFQVTLLLNNSGNVFAENVLVEFNAYGGLLFIREKKEDREKEIAQAITFPPPPTPPKGNWQTTSHSILSSFAGINPLRHKLFPFENNFLGRNELLTDNKIDRNGFYYKTQKYGLPTKSIIFECGEFRHKAEPEEFDLNVFIPDSIELTHNLALEAVFSSKNLPEPVKHLIKIHIQVSEKDSVQEVYNFLHSKKYLTK